MGCKRSRLGRSGSWESARLLVDMSVGVECRPKGGTVGEPGALAVGLSRIELENVFRDAT